MAGIGQLTAAPALHSQAQPSEEWLDCDFVENLIFLSGEVNEVPVMMLLDSGANVTALDLAFAGEIGLGRGWPIDTTGTGGSQRSWLHDGVKLRVGPQLLENQTVVALDLSGLTAVLQTEVHIILGREAFKHFAVDIDYPNERVAFRDPATLEYAAEDRVINLYPNRGGTWAVYVDIEYGSVGKFQLDTGSTGTVDIYERFVLEHGLLEGRRPLSLNRGVGVGGLHWDVLGTVSSLHFAGVPTRSISSAFGVIDHGPDGSLDGSLGGAFLSQFRLRFDPLRNLLTVFPSEDRAPIPKNRSGLLTTLGDEGLCVYYVRPGSPAAAAGWKEGSIIVAVDGIAVGPDFDLTTTARWSQRPAGRSVTLQDAEGRESVLVLADYY